MLHGRPGEDGTIQGLLEIVGIPYSHSGVLASSAAMHKEISKIILAAANVPVPGGLVARRAEAAKAHLLPPPYVIKPVAEGSSVGVFIVREDHDHPPQELTRGDWAFGDMVLVEPFIPGKELTCAVMGDKALGVIEIVSATKFYDYEAKYAPGGSKHLLPAPVSKEVYEACQRLALAAHQCTRMPWRLPRRFPLRRQQARRRRFVLPGSEHSARHDRNLAGARDGRPCRHQLRGAGGLDGRGRFAGAVIAVALESILIPAASASKSPIQRLFRHARTISRPAAHNL